MAYAVHAQGVYKSVNSGNRQLDILKGVDLSVQPGESLAIIGRSGAGKTTLLSLLAGLDLASQGEIQLAGENISQYDEEERARLRAGRVGFVFQSFQLLEGFNALENVRLSAELAGLDDAENLARQALESVELGERMDHYPRQLSGGERQRVALARAFAGQPSILFADEPTGNLDESTGAHIVELLFRMNAEQNTTLILVTHDLSLAQRCQRQCRLDDGRLVDA